MIGQLIQKKDRSSVKKRSFIEIAASIALVFCLASGMLGAQSSDVPAVHTLRANGDHFELRVSHELTGGIGYARRARWD
jgi:hypothetical protein